MKPLYGRLNEAGLSSSFVRKHVLPEWWTDSLAKNPVAYAEAAGLIAQHLCIDLSVLLSETRTIEPDDCHARFKKRADAAHEDLVWAKHLGMSAARLAADALGDAPEQHAWTAGTLRAHLLADGKPWITLDDLLSFCWVQGIPVLHIAHFPNSKKMDGMAIRVGERPVIVLGSKRKHPAWLSFTLAHELGHILLGHLEPDMAEFDAKLDFETEDVQEREANAFAVEVLTGYPDSVFGARQHFYNARQLGDSIRQASRQHRIAPGVIALNYAYHNTNKWGLVNAALRDLQPQANAPRMVRIAALHALDFDRLSEERAAFLLRLMGATEDERAAADADAHA